MIKPLIVASLVTLAVMNPAQAGTLNFNLEGLNPDGSSTYRGTVALTEVAIGPDGEKSGIVTWVVDRGKPIRGIVMSSKDSPGRLSISFPNSPIPGVALAQFNDDGSVKLRWFIGSDGIGSELWTPRK